MTITHPVDFVRLAGDGRVTGDGVRRTGDSIFQTEDGTGGADPVPTTYFFLIFSIANNPLRPCAATNIRPESGSTQRRTHFRPRLPALIASCQWNEVSHNCKTWIWTHKYPTANLKAALKRAHLLVGLSVQHRDGCSSHKLLGKNDDVGVYATMVGMNLWVNSEFRRETQQTPRALSLSLSLRYGAIAGGIGRNGMLGTVVDANSLRPL